MVWTSDAKVDDELGLNERHLAEQIVINGNRKVINSFEFSQTLCIMWKTFPHIGLGIQQTSRTRAFDD